MKVKPWGGGGSLTLAGLLHQLDFRPEHLQNRRGLLAQQHALDSQLIAERGQAGEQMSAHWTENIARKELE